MSQENKGIVSLSTKDNKITLVVKCDTTNQLVYILEALLSPDGVSKFIQVSEDNKES